MAPKQQELLPSYDESFLDRHAGSLLLDPTVAIIELVANAWDAGAVNVQITWPNGPGEKFVIADDGCGMTPVEFENRWMTLHYNRQREFDDEVQFPPGVRTNRRVAFGMNGIGRHAMFCFASEYKIETTKGGTKTTAPCAARRRPARARSR